jgi:cell division protein FtsQ
MSETLKPVNRRTKRKRAEEKADDLSAVPTKPGDLEPSKPPSRMWGVVRSVMGVMVVVGIATLVAWGAKKYVTTSPRFAVQHVLVSGAKMRTAEEIAAIANVAPGDNIFVLDLDRAQTKLAKDPWMAKATLSRRLPGTVIIDVDERQAAAIVACGETFLATPSGEVFKKLEPGDPNDLVVVTGIERDALENDREGTARTVRRALDLAGDYDSSSLSSHGRLQEVHVGTTGVSLIIGKSGLEIVLGQPPYRKKLEQASRVLAELHKRGTKTDALLLDNDTRPDRVVARVH